MVARRIRSDGRMGKLLEQNLFDHGVSTGRSGLISRSFDLHSSAGPSTVFYEV